ncbi:mandelate racemase/muconate lactonizing enzyme family protein [Pseudonocardia cypriaca]|uniref:L-alanine-DL-glutamate epimerase-like enolase superfamily enzyme n=1 Tax=Pseudonocardia cypriaca TaxID=882449 RepID=A0A543GCH6_9PSEU|nr:mandelate racemase/muconate lactonizing enzyme family protein [Pseudonocardia cypriaca]TQM43772.1 L-alanine-DL-glutamate epimerase-like enolase superfamily enzyme [Pseudonocardia cypriaca]
MRITDIRVAGLRGATPEGGWSRELQPDDVVHTLVTVHTDAGLVGVGSVFSSEALVQGALDVLRPICLGADPREPDRISQLMHQDTFWLGRGGAITHAVSGIDIALWDILGQATGLPVSTLLGGRYRDRVRPYASVLIEEPARMNATLTRLAEQGFTAFKIGWGHFGRVDPAADERVVRAAREAVGAEALLAVDAGGSDAFWPHGTAWATRTADMLADHGVAWFEEALRPDDLDGFVRLRSASRVPISGGEVLTRRQDFTRFLTAGAFDIVQPDTTKGGGLSESRRVAWLADDLGVRFIPHGWNTGVGLAADLHLAASLPHTDLVEYKTGSAYIDELVAGGFHLDDDGMLAVPSGPGLGIRLDDDGLDRYSPGHRLFRR